MLIYLRGRDKQKKRNGGWWKRLIRSRRNRDKCFVFRLSYSFTLPTHTQIQDTHSPLSKRTTSINGHYLKGIISLFTGRGRERETDKERREAARVWTLFWSLWEYVREGGMQLERERTGASSPPRGDKSINNYYYLITNYKFLLGNNYY